LSLKSPSIFNTSKNENNSQINVQLNVLKYYDINYLVTINAQRNENIDIKMISLPLRAVALRG